ncbi:CDP-diacylglycerol--glycerol-3-phosphate 3-phosphatidyltransferase [Garciella nitratireducens DSM 15102]|uniref:CDP-diacylglycerol--glycerol-3-phosphate 3-phosphatidyltransferase n=2 Tax=Garciella TaxID=218204 RepID=A0A1T4JWA3_9FIRM|nr:CDP-diacylglycerol--glycerol-3-phosphate 3-phosphatidyltransferase [Garciella nitratireducens]SJZ34347.1 CDP-diacylglycerol--glycerol-3-phosphate 3-phosphatidyltransferase [Garciella nitratireducens DSM 15102]
MKMNLANKITIFRILLIPVFMICIYIDIPYNYYIAAFLFLFAAITDGVDGYIARSRNQITVFGKFIDPLADKLLISSALIILVELGAISSWIAFIIIAREFIITGFRVLAAADGIVIAASGWGKIKTVTQIIAIFSTLLNNYPFSLIAFPFSKITMFLAVIFTIISGIDYIYTNRKIFIEEEDK